MDETLKALNDTILCSVSTRGRYFTTLPLALMAIANQTLKPTKLIIFDDNDEPKDMRNEQMYQYIFQILDFKGIAWEWQYAQKKGQHYNHQVANLMGFTYVWRVDDDCVPEPHVLSNLYFAVYKNTKIGAVGGAILTPPMPNFSAEEVSGHIDDIYSEPNIQWAPIKEARSVDHLHCSFLYRAGIHDYNLNLSRVAHREETLFTYGLVSKGYRVCVIPYTNTWHLKNSTGGIRSETSQAMFDHDEQLFQSIVGLGSKTIVVLDCGLGDHLVFSKILPDLDDPVVFSCYPDIIPGRSIQEAKDLFGSIDCYNIYRKMDEWKWTSSLESAFRKMYQV